MLNRLQELLRAIVARVNLQGATRGLARCRQPSTIPMKLRFGNQARCLFALHESKDWIGIDQDFFDALITTPAVFGERAADDLR